MGGNLEQMSQMSQVHRSDQFGCGSLFQKGVNSLLMKSGLEEVLEFREDAVHISCELDL